MLYEASWDTNRVVERLIEGKNLHIFTKSLSDGERCVLAEAVEDPDVLFTREGLPLMEKLVELNLVFDVAERKPYLWIDQPPPERDLELGVGRHIAWQTPLHREAVKRTLQLIKLIMPEPIQ